MNVLFLELLNAALVLIHGFAALFMFSTWLSRIPGGEYRFAIGVFIHLRVLIRVLRPEKGYHSKSYLARL